MKSRLIKLTLAAALLVGLAGRGEAATTTWFPQEFKCPVCQAKNTFLVVGSYGNYIYHWDSKFQLIYWPRTDSPVLYSCRQCRLTTFMWDFEEVPKDKHAALRKALEGVKMDYVGEKSEYYKEADYLRIPMTQRLAAASKVYEVLGRDDWFWGEFYRTLGYHFEAEKQQTEADAARRRALAIAEKMLADKAHAETRKELLYITGAMRYFLRDEAGALKDFREALTLKYQNSKFGKEKAQGYDAYLTDLLNQDLKKLGSGGEAKKPKAD